MEVVALLTAHRSLHGEAGVVYLLPRQRKPAAGLRGCIQPEQAVQIVVAVEVDLLSDERAARRQDATHLGCQECFVPVGDEVERAVGEGQPTALGSVLLGCVLLGTIVVSTIVLGSVVLGSVVLGTVSVGALLADVIRRALVLDDRYP